MKRVLKCAACLLCLILLFSACAKKETAAPENDELHIYASFYPIYAITEELMKDIPDAQLHCLVQPQDGCLRDYQLSDWDLALIEKSADMIIIGGRGLESFENILYSLGEGGPAVAAVLYNKELASGTGELADEGQENHWNGANPHLFMDPEGGILIAESIAAQLSVADPANSEIYMRNLAETENKLRSVSEEYKQYLSEFSGKKVILMNEAAVYIAQAYNLDAERCILRDSGEAYFDYELQKMLLELKECESRIILIEKQAPERFCEALEAAGFTLAKIDTMSAKRPEEGFEGYLEALRKNAVLVKAAFEAAE